MHGGGGRPPASRLAFPILAQSDLPKPALIEAFRSDDAACLFATLGFWQGVDMPGPTLSLVTIDRHPLPPPRRPGAPGPPGPGRGGRLPARRPAPCRDPPGPGGRAPDPVGRRPRGGRGARQPAGTGQLPRRLACPGPSDAPHGRPRRQVVAFLRRDIVRRRRSGCDGPAVVGSEPQAIEGVVPLLPVLLHPHEELQVGAGRHLRPYRRAHLLQGRARPCR